MNSTQLIGLIMGGILFCFSLWQFRILGKRSAVILVKKDQMEKELFFFLYRQTVRRFQMNALFAAASLGMFIGLALAPQAHPRLFLCTWGMVLLLLAVGIFLAFIDFVAVRLHFKLEQQQNEAEKIGLEYKIRQMQKQAEQKSNVSASTEDKTFQQPDSSEQKDQ